MVRKFHSSENDLELGSIMSEESPELSPGEDSDNSGLYSKYLERFPEDQRGTAEEVFKEWDSNVTKKFQSIHDEYRDYKPIFDSYEADAVKAGMQVLEMIRDNPREVYDQLANQFNFKDVKDAVDTATKVADKVSKGQEIPQEYLDKFAQYDEILGQVADYMATQHTEATQAEELKQFQAKLDDLTGKYGEYDQEWVLAKIASGIDPEVAVKSYHAFVEKLTGKKPQAPAVLGSSGGGITKPIDFSKLNSTDTKKLVSEYLKNTEE
jgi:hypothetical protein